ncbi:KTSC domain-containing protein, partial [Bacillus cereus]
MMKLSPVISKNIVAVGYNPFSMILRIQLKNGMYDFFNVPESIYTGLLHAQSKSY